MKYIKNLFYFYFKPSKEITHPLSLRSKIISILYFLLLKYSFLLFFVSIRYLLVLQNIVPPLKYDNKMELISNSFFFSVLLGPILEEILFRLWLVYSKVNLSITITCLLLWISALAFDIYWFDTIKLVIYYILSFIVLFTLFFFLFKKYESEKLINFWKKNQKVFITISSILFGVIHIWNYTDSNNSILYYIITFSPQVFSGFILCYLRVRMGFEVGVATHSLNNFIPLILSKII
ncbi:CPBP family intramembrane metalloprotease [Chryseobacterium nematophagum]|uniref:CPBP family intramembrane metalloprotease n=1 Tax=Chryseobacterium nematophagum TaxID=2305228 RepID=A0A3M7LBU2_9FLAO|nr:CPBP family intramembrane metalloprotease [Chryseobacterium nematophagum]